MNIDIKKIRKKLDKLDVKLLHIIKERSLLVDQVVKLKKKKEEVVDRPRIKFILKRIKEKSIEAKIDPMITLRNDKCFYSV
jgi:chorismate mutase